jgi:hypothetical protein
MQFGSSLDSFPFFTRLNPCVAHCSTDSIPWVHHSREEGSLDYDRGFVRLHIHMNFDTIIYRQQPVEGDTVSQLIGNQTLLLKEVHLDGQGRCTRVVARTRRPPTDKWC